MYCCFINIQDYCLTSVSNDCCSLPYLIDGLLFDSILMLGCDLCCCCSDDTSSTDYLSDESCLAVFDRASGSSQNCLLVLKTFSCKAALLKFGIC